MDPFSYFPVEIISNVLSNLTPKQIVSLQRVSKLWQSIITHLCTMNWAHSHLEPYAKICWRGEGKWDQFARNAQSPFVFKEGLVQYKFKPPSNPFITSTFITSIDPDSGSLCIWERNPESFRLEEPYEVSLQEVFGWPAHVARSNPWNYRWSGKILGASAELILLHGVLSLSQPPPVGNTQVGGPGQWKLYDTLVCFDPVGRSVRWRRALSDAEGEQYRYSISPKFNQLAEKCLQPILEDGRRGMCYTRRLGRSVYIGKKTLFLLLQLDRSSSDGIKVSCSEERVSSSILLLDVCTGKTMQQHFQPSFGQNTNPELPNYLLKKVKDLDRGLEANITAGPSVDNTLWYATVRLKDTRLEQITLTINASSSGKTLASVGLPLLNKKPDRGRLWRRPQLKSFPLPDCEETGAKMTKLVFEMSFKEREKDYESFITWIPLAEEECEKMYWSYTMTVSTTSQLNEEPTVTVSDMTLSRYEPPRIVRLEMNLTVREALLFCEKMCAGIRVISKSDSIDNMSEDASCWAEVIFFEEERERRTYDETRKLMKKYYVATSSRALLEPGERKAKGGDDSPLELDYPFERDLELKSFNDDVFALPGYILFF